MRMAALVMLACAAAGGAALAASPAEAPMPEYQVKAVFLFNFTKFVDWPADKFAAADAPMVICTLGPDLLGESLERIVSGRQVEHRSLVVRRPASGDEVRSCHVLFAVAVAQNQLRLDLAAAASAHVLTVGDGDAFLEAGGMISFSIEEGSVRFAISRHAAESAGLKISSQLLNLARVVE